jgi:hypothetical protein
MLNKMAEEEVFFLNTLVFPSQNYSTTVIHTSSSSSSSSYTDKGAKPGNLQTKQ